MNRALVVLCLSAVTCLTLGSRSPRPPVQAASRPVRRSRWGRYSLSIKRSC